jgi:hypothetical protein
MRIMNPDEEHPHTWTNNNNNLYTSVHTLTNHSHQHYPTAHNQQDAGTETGHESLHDMMGVPPSRLPIIHSYSDIANLGTYLPEHSPNNDLLTLVQSYAWSATLRRIRTHPSEATSVGEQGRTPLHVACDHDAPAFVVRALLEANPGAVMMVGTSDMNPLHITCSSQHASVEVVRVLLELSEDTIGVTAMKDVDGDTSLHAACRCGAPIQVIEILLNANPSLVQVRDYEGLTPLLRLWVRYFVTLGDDTIDGVSSRDDVKGELAEAWSKTELLLRASYYGSLEGYSNESKLFDSVKEDIPCSRHDEDEEKPKAASDDTCGKKKRSQSESQNENSDECDGLASTKENQESSKDKDHPQLVAEPLHVIHAASAIDCPRAVVRIASILYPQQLDEFDPSQRTPLMIAAMAPMFKEHDLSDEGYSLEELIHGDDVNTTEYHHDDYTEQKQPSVIDVLLQAGADARLGHGNFKKGRMPLHAAIVSGKRWNEGLKILRNAYPDSLMKLDKQTGLYAFMLAAAAGSGELASEITTAGRTSDLCTIFELLRNQPGLIDHIS